MDYCFDVAVAGGGINGCGIAADASLRGLSVVLIEQDDLASKTSSSSTKLIHGGLRYLEQYDFSLVKKALNERQILLDLAPNLVFPRPFVLPLQASMRSPWLIRLGLFFYDHLSRTNRLPHSKRIRRKRNQACFQPLQDQFNNGFVYYDCCTDDARLTLCNALQAEANGARILTRTRLQRADTDAGLWHLQCQKKDGQTIQIKAKTLINAAGPWVEDVNRQAGITGGRRISLVKGSHLVVPRLYDGEQAYLLQHEDKRVVFVIPYHGYSMIGTTDVLCQAPVEQLTISLAETDYLLNLVSHYFKQRLTADQIVTSWSGVRPLLAADDETPQTISRDYSYQYSEAPLPAIAIYGGKITTYRQLARDAVNELRAVFPGLPDSRTDKIPLPGAQWNGMDYNRYLDYARQHYAWMDDDLLSRLLATYGTRAERIVSSCHSMADLGESFGHGLHQREVDYLLTEEWADNSDDILWRRTRLGLQFSDSSRERLNAYINSRESC